MSQPALLARLTCVDGRRDEVVEVFRVMFDHIESGGEPGTEVYAMHEDAKDPDVLWFYELYRDDDALAAHAGSDTMAAVQRGLEGLLAGRPELTRLTPRTTFGLPG